MPTYEDHLYVYFHDVIEALAKRAYMRGMDEEQKSEFEKELRNMPIEALEVQKMVKKMERVN